MRRAAVLAIVAALGAVTGAAHPVEAVAAPAISAAAPAAACPDQVVPPPPPADEESAAPAPLPLPVPDEPVGGPSLGCGEIAATAAPLPVIAAASFVLADLDTGGILATRAPHARHRPASTLKVLTALVVLRDLDPDLVVDGTPEDLRVVGSKAGIGPGGRYTVRELLHGLLLNSGNDTAQALARVLGGDAAAVARMAALARELGALDTRPATPSGLDGPGMSSSAYDVALLYRVAMRDPLFATTIATPSVLFPGYDAEHPAFELFNSSRLLTGYPGSLGSKTGFTDAARHTVVSAAQRDGRRLVVAVMRGENQPAPLWRQAATLLDWGFAQPVGTPPVGVLVDRAPAPPAATTAPVADREPVGSRPATPTTGMSAGAVLVLLGSLAGIAALALVAALVATRRRR
ncbi:D-alanyl-D-alanine carboxypeptidase family protein [Pseudonocardia humida]|uniref:D-alanyl-D-alanine carboxypeptidase family protein n=1 Tax=Pseudonocardia humida TaxID=2800819 RepID=UPI00207CBF47|nr:serine hydrolase [Pseudonocardia humida]